MVDRRVALFASACVLSISACALLGEKERDPIMGLSSVCVPTKDDIAVIAVGQIELGDGERWQDINIELRGEHTDAVSVGVGGDTVGAGTAIYLTPEFAADIRTANPLDLDGPGTWSLVLLVDVDDTEFEFVAEHVTYRSGGRTHRSTEGFEFRSSNDGCEEEGDDDAADGT